MIKSLDINIKSAEYLLLMIFLIIILSNSILAVRINEVELNPAGEDYGNEWIEIYSDSNIDLTEWRIENVKGKNMSLNGSFSGYEVIIGSYNFLANDKQKLILYDNSGSKADETDVISDSANDGRSWQYCEKWEFSENTKEKENNCERKMEIIENKTERKKIEVKEEEKREQNNKEADINKETTANVIKENIVEESPAEVLYLNPKGIKSNEIWKSNTRKIKEYSIFGFTLLLLLVLIYLIKIRKDGREYNYGDE